MIPNIRVVVGFCIVAVLGYSIASIWVVAYSTDAALRGDVIGTWKSFAVAAFALWIARNAGKGAEEVALDKQRTENTTKALDTIGAAIASSPPTDGPTGYPGDPVAVKEE